eukprot:g36.t1
MSVDAIADVWSVEAVDILCRAARSRYVLQRLRVAMPSEHTLLGRHFPIEVQLWHEPAIHRDIRMLIADRTKVQQMLRRFQELTQDWQGELQQLEDPADNESFPDLQTEQDWAESVRQHSVKETEHGDGAFLMEHVQQLHERILQIDQQVELLNARLQRPESARMVVLSLFYWTPHTAETEAGEVLKWLHQSVTRNVEAGAGAMENRTQPQAVTEELRKKDTLTAFGYEGSFTRPPCTPVVRWFLISEPQAARAKEHGWLFLRRWLTPGVDILGLADVLRSDQSTECQQAEGLEVCGLGLRPSDGVWWRGPIKQTPKSPRSLPDLPMRTASLGPGRETHLSAQLVSQLPWPYVQACCAVLLLCSVAMLGTTCSMWSNQCLAGFGLSGRKARPIPGDMGEPGNAYNGQIRDGLFHGRGTLIYAGNERYEGDWVYGKREGHGRFTYQDGAIFEGNWQEDRVPFPERKRVAVFASGNRYEGMWENGRIHGHGSLTYSNKDQYEGEWHDGKMHGRGTYKYAEGDVYQGEWKDDKRHGKGVVTYVSARGSVVEKFEGDWVNGKMHGQGKSHGWKMCSGYQYADGGVYEGDWQDGKMHGRGIYVFPNGNTYDGEWVNDMKEGYGTLTYQNGEKYDGYWKQDKVHGQGTLVYTYGDKFIGQWVDAKKEGEGELIYSNGDRFKGQWVDDRASGHGLFQYSNGNRYEGQWLDDKRPAAQSSAPEDGSVYDGEFAYGRKDGRGLLKLQSGHVLSGQWKQGELVQVADFVFAADSPWKNPDL